MEKDTPAKCNIIFYIRRFDPEHDEAPWLQQFTVQVERGMTILDGLHQIKETQDSSLAWRFSCRMGVCGSCAMLINGKPALACNTQILEVSDQIITLAPLPNFAIIKDLVPDLTPLFEKHRYIHPYIKRQDLEEMTNPTGEYFQTPQELERYLQFTYCIKCGAVSLPAQLWLLTETIWDQQRLAQAYRYNTDSRDGGFKARKDMVDVSMGFLTVIMLGNVLEFVLREWIRHERFSL